MRYISPVNDLTLFAQDGTTLYKFKNGVLDLGAGVEIDTAVKDPVGGTLQRVYATDIAGLTTSLIEMCGQGALATYNYRMFYVADPLTDITFDTVAVHGHCYEVAVGSVTIGTKTYVVGEHFVYTSDLAAADIVFASGATVKLVMNCCECFDLTAEFRQKHLLNGDEPADYYKHRYPSGYAPRNSTEAGDIDTGFGYIR